MAVGIIDIRRAEAVPRAITADPPEEHLGFTFPGHLGKFIHRGDDQGGQASVNLLIDDHNGQAFIRGLAMEKGAFSQRIAAVLEGAPAATFHQLHPNIVGIQWACRTTGSW